MKNSQNIQITGATTVSMGDVIQQVGGPVSANEEKQPPVKVLFLAANPSGTEQLRLDREAKSIQAALRSCTSSSFDLEQSWAASILELQDGLLRYKPDILHWSGHGRSDGLLVLESDATMRDMSGGSVRGGTPGMEFISSLGRLFAIAKGRIRCAVLNACHSEEAARVIAEHIDCVIGMSDSLGDESAIRFSWAFYHSLAHGKNVRAAFEIATAQIGLAGLGDSAIPRLLATRTDPTLISFINPETGLAPNP